MKTLKYTLIADGSSDRILLNIIKWLLDDLYPTLPNEGAYADFRALPKPPNKSDIKKQIEVAREYYPFDILFYHRDAESKSKDIMERRTLEIQQHLTDEEQSITVCIIPIRMMEAWLLFDENAIKKAAGNRNYEGRINLPDLKKVENEKDPKILLYNLLKTVSGRKGRNLKRFNTAYHTHLVAENIDDFNPLRELSAFRFFEQNLRNTIDTLLKSSEVSD